MNDENLETILDICVEDLKRGVSFDEVLAKYPAHAEELKSLLTIVSKLESAPKAEPSTNAAYNALVKIGKHLSEQKVFKPRFNLDWFIIPRFAFARVMAVILIVGLVTWTTGTASASALPGDILYPFKLMTEKVTLILTANSEGKTELRLTFSERRMQELLANYRENGVIDKNLIKDMLDEAKLALDGISDLPKEKQPLFYSKVVHFNDFQKDTLQSIQPQVSGAQKTYIDRAIEVCSSRGAWMQKMMKQEKYWPWDESSCCGWK